MSNVKRPGIDVAKGAQARALGPSHLILTTPTPMSVTPAVHEGSAKGAPAFPTGAVCPLDPTKYPWVAPRPASAQSASDRKRSLFFEYPMGWLCVAGAGAALFCWTLPVSLYFTLCMLALVGASRLTQEWRSAAYAVLIPACVGFGLLLLAIPVFYFLTPIEDFTAVHFSWVDRKLVEVHRILEPQSTEAAKVAQPFDFLGWVFQHLDGLRWTFLLLLLPLSCLCSQVRRVSAALRVRRTLAAVVSTLALVTSFSFVVDNNVTGPLVSRIVHDIRLKYGENIESAAHDGANAIMVVDSADVFRNSALLARLVGEYKLPSMFTFFEPAEAGGLMAYSFDLVELYKRAANNIDAILKGAKPGDIPFYQASKFELSINLKAAKQLGISVPPALLASADGVID